MIASLLEERILVLDGAMGTMIQSLNLEEKDFRGEKFSRNPVDLMGNNEVLNITNSQVIMDIHRMYLDAGSDIIETNTFSANSISQSDYGLENAAREMNVRAAEIARLAADEAMHNDPSQTRFVAGAIGPTNKTLSSSENVDDPSYRSISFDELRDSYFEQAEALIEGGVDIILIETIFDVLNSKAAIVATIDAFEKTGKRLPIMISVTFIQEGSNRTVFGQTIDAFWATISHAQPLSVGINCGLGAKSLSANLSELSRISNTFIHCYPNAGLPNPLSETGFDETPEITSREIGKLADAGLLNIVGGCCGTTPEHIRAIRSAVESVKPREISHSVADLSQLTGFIENQMGHSHNESCNHWPHPDTTFSGLETYSVRENSNFTMIGERTNVSGSAKFLKLIESNDFDGALQVALHQVRSGANIIDVNMDEGMLDSVACMERFLKLVATEPDVAKVPIMIDSSDWDVIKAGIKCIQGKPIVNSISLKDGEMKFIERAQFIKEHGGALVVMAFDEEGQAESVERKVEICERAYNILIEKLGFNPSDIVFDPNVLAVATGISAHNRFAINFIEAIPLIKEKCPDSKISGGISNLSFSFRGNNAVREAFHSAFLYHSIEAGLDMGIVNPGLLVPYEEIPSELLSRVEDVLFDRRKDATERMVDFAEGYSREANRRQGNSDWRNLPIEDRLGFSLINGIVDHIEEDVSEALEIFTTPLEVIEGPLMSAMSEVGDLFGSGKMFLPQVVKSARTMKQAVNFLEPLMDSVSQEKNSRGTIVMATVKGDVHDIGKNIVGVVLGCNNFDVIDLGVMVSADSILNAAEENEADMIGLSGLITPSLREMSHVAREMQSRGISTPLLIGGATTSRQHTAVRIATESDSPVIHVKDASRVVDISSRIVDPVARRSLVAENHAAQESTRKLYKEISRKPMLPLKEARMRRLEYNWDKVDIPQPPFLGSRLIPEIDLHELSELIDWTFFLTSWDIPRRFPNVLDDEKYGEAARQLLSDAEKILQEICENRKLTASAVFGFWPANSDADDILLRDPSTGEVLSRLTMLRQQQDRGKSRNACLSDFIAPLDSGIQDFVGMFAVTSGIGLDELVWEYTNSEDDYGGIMAGLLADRLSEAAAEWLHREVRSHWGFPDSPETALSEIFSGDFRSIRPAYGYPACPDLSELRKVFDLLDANRAGMSLTENSAISPSSGVSGLLIAHPESHYFSVGKIDKEQMESYSLRKGIPLSEAESLLYGNLGYFTD